MAGQSDVDQAGDHHGDAEHPSGGQEREGEEVPHHLRGHEADGEPHTGDCTEHLSAGEKPKRNGDNCDTSVTFLFMWEKLFEVWRLTEAQEGLWESGR